jgi:hypothetical protein
MTDPTMEAILDAGGDITVSQVCVLCEHQL